jgi:hypothetical protein
MAGRKLSAKTEEEVVFMEHLLVQCNHLLKLTEDYAAAKKNADTYLQPITRALGQIRQNAMMKNLGPVADQAGMLGVAAQRGSQVQRTRTLREGIAGYKVLLERTIKATVEADQRHRAQEDRARADARAAAAPWDSPSGPDKPHG